MISIQRRIEAGEENQLPFKWIQVSTSRIVRMNYSWQSSIFQPLFTHISTTMLRNATARNPLSPTQDHCLQPAYITVMHQLKPHGLKCLHSDLLPLTTHRSGQLSQLKCFHCQILQDMWDLARISLVYLESSVCKSSAY